MSSTGETEMDKLFGRYDAAMLRRLFDDAGVSDVLRLRGFAGIQVRVESTGRALPHILVHGRKQGAMHLLLDACIGEAVVRPAVFAQHGYHMERQVELAVVHWVREEDPTVAFARERPALPLQDHPGLGVLRQAFRVLVRIATEMGKDGIVSVPKFFHDAVIFFRSRLFLFLDGEEQGRFEALARDLRPLSLRDASLSLASGVVRDHNDAIVIWTPGYQAFPISPELTAYFHSREYATQTAAGYAGHRYHVDVETPRNTVRREPPRAPRRR